MLWTFIFQPPPSHFMTAMSVISFTSLANAGFSELRGKHMQYSKFWNFKSSSQEQSIAPPKQKQQKQVQLSGRTGMLIAYSPAFVAALTSLLFLPHQNTRDLMLSSALTLHFLKRLFEVLCVHIYSGGMAVDTTITISLSYFLSTATMVYGQYLTQGLPEPPTDLKNAGIFVFLIGISGNLYHHFLLSKIRSKGDKEYKIPKDGLFSLVICPHYLFEITGFVGVSLISQTLYAFALAMGTALYLTGRSCATRKWYLSKFEDFPQSVKAIIPYLL